LDSLPQKNPNIGQEACQEVSQEARQELNTSTGSKPEEKQTEKDEYTALAAESLLEVNM
jgi:hypothetical protein